MTASGCQWSPVLPIHHFATGIIIPSIFDPVNWYSKFCQLAESNLLPTDLSVTAYNSTAVSMWFHEPVRCEIESGIVTKQTTSEQFCVLSRSAVRPLKISFIWVLLVYYLASCITLLTELGCNIRPTQINWADLNSSVHWLLGPETLGKEVGKNI